LSVKETKQHWVTEFKKFVFLSSFRIIQSLYYSPSSRCINDSDRHYRGRSFIRVILTVNIKRYQFTSRINKMDISSLLQIDERNTNFLNSVTRLFTSPSCGYNNFRCWKQQLGEKGYVWKQDNIDFCQDMENIRYLLPY
jgi:hypothetical protein